MDDIDEELEKIGSLTFLRRQVRYNFYALLVTLAIASITGLVFGFLVSLPCFKFKTPFKDSEFKDVEEAECLVCGPAEFRRKTRD